MSLKIPRNVNMWWSPWFRVITWENPHSIGFKNGSQHTIKSLQKQMKSNLSYRRNLTRYFGKKVTTDYGDGDETLGDSKDYLNDNTEVISKLIVVKFRKSTWNINYSTFYRGELIQTLQSRFSWDAERRCILYFLSLSHRKNYQFYFISCILSCLFL